MLRVYTFRAINCDWKRIKLLSRNWIRIFQCCHASKVFKAISELQATQKSVWSQIIESVLRLLKVSPDEAVSIFLYKTQNSGSSIFSNIYLRQFLTRSGVPIPLSWTETAGLLSENRFTNSQAQIIRDYIGSIPPVRTIRADRLELLSELMKVWERIVKWADRGTKKKIAVQVQFIWPHHRLK